MYTADFTTITVKKICLYFLFMITRTITILWPFEEAGMFIPLI
jgi:hypothetical protein